jgi:putative flippase GtrA
MESLWSLKFLRFVAVGALNTGLTFGIYAVLIFGFDVHYLVALTIAWIVGVAVNYGANFIWSFQIATVPAYDARFIRYAVVYFVAFLANAFLLQYAVRSLGLPSLLAQALIVPAIVILSYLGAVFWALR